MWGWGADTRQRLSDPAPTPGGLEPGAGGSGCQITPVLGSLGPQSQAAVPHGNSACKSRLPWHFDWQISGGTEGVAGPIPSKEPAIALSRIYQLQEAPLGQKEAQSATAVPLGGGTWKSGGGAPGVLFGLLGWQETLHGAEMGPAGPPGPRRVKALDTNEIPRARGSGAARSPRLTLQRRSGEGGVCGIGAGVPGQLYPRGGV